MGWISIAMDLLLFACGLFVLDCVRRPLDG